MSAGERSAATWRAAQTAAPLLIPTKSPSSRASRCAMANAGRSSTLITRGLAVGEVELRDWSRITIRELLVGGTLGLVLGLAGFGGAFLLGENATLGLIVAVTLVAVVGVMTTVGGLLPLGFKRLGFDPAIASSPFIASLADLTGVLIYMTIAGLLLAGR